MLDIPDPWVHVSGYYLNADGKTIRYRHPDTGLELYVEAVLDPESGDLEYRPSVFDSDGDMVEYPDVFRDKGEAGDRLREHAEEHA